MSAEGGDNAPRDKSSPSALFPLGIWKMTEIEEELGTFLLEMGGQEAKLTFTSEWTTEQVEATIRLFFMSPLMWTMTQKLVNANIKGTLAITKQGKMEAVEMLTEALAMARRIVQENLDFLVEHRD